MVSIILSKIEQSLNQDIQKITQKAYGKEREQACMNFFKIHPHLLDTKQLYPYFQATYLALDNLNQSASLDWNNARYLCFDHPFPLYSIQKLRTLNQKTGSAYLKALLTLAQARFNLSSDFKNQAMQSVYNPQFEQDLMEQITVDSKKLILDYTIPVRCFNLKTKIICSYSKLFNLGKNYVAYFKNLDQCIEFFDLIRCNSQAILDNLLKNELEIKAEAQTFVGTTNDVLLIPEVQDCLCDIISFMISINKVESAKVYAMTLEIIIQEQTKKLMSTSEQKIYSVIPLRSITTLIRYYAHTQNIKIALKLYEKALAIFSLNSYSDLHKFYYYQDLALSFPVIEKNSTNISTQFPLMSIQNDYSTLALQQAIDFWKSHGNNYLFLKFIFDYITINHIPFDLINKTKEILEAKYS